MCKEFLKCPKCGEILKIEVVGTNICLHPEWDELTYDAIYSYTPIKTELFCDCGYRKKIGKGGLHDRA